MGNSHVGERHHPSDFELNTNYMELLFMVLVSYLQSKKSSAKACGRQELLDPTPPTRSISETLAPAYVADVRVNFCCVTCMALVQNHGRRRVGFPMRLVDLRTFHPEPQIQTPAYRSELTDLFLLPLFIFLPRPFSLSSPRCHHDLSFPPIFHLLRFAFDTAPLVLPLCTLPCLL